MPYTYESMWSVWMLSLEILGESWVGFFFALAGFGASWGKLRAAAPRRLLPQPRTLLRRLLPIAPAYLVAFTLMRVLQRAVPAMLGLNVTVQPTACSIELEGLGVSFGLLPKFLNDLLFPPTATCVELANPPGWFLCVLIVFWLLEEAVVSLVSRAAATRPFDGLRWPPRRTSDQPVQRLPSVRPHRCCATLCSRTRLQRAHAQRAHTCATTRAPTRTMRACVCVAAS